MGKLNSVQLIGNMGAPIQMHFFGDDNCIGRVSLATTEKYKNREGEMVENVEWHNLVFRNKVAKIIEKYTKKGSMLFVEGRLKYRSYESEGVTKFVTEINVRNFEFLSPSSSTSSSKQTTVETPPQQNGSEPDDDLPF